MLKVLFLSLVLTLTLMSVVAGVGIALFSWRLSRRNRVVVDTETAAPLLWLWSPAQTAKLHRRLRTALTPVHHPRPRGRGVRLQRRAPISQSPALDELRRTLVEQAITLDAQLVACTRLPRSLRRHHLRLLRAQVREIEQLSHRIQGHSLRPGLTPVGGSHDSPAEALAGVSARLDLLDQAHKELSAIEQASGFLDPEVVLQRIAPPPAPSVTPRRAASGPSNECTFNRSNLGRLEPPPRFNAPPTSSTGSMSP